MPAGLSPISPASSEGDGGRVRPEAVVRRALDLAASLDDPSLLEHCVTQPFPLPVASAPALTTPIDETRPDLSLSFAGSVLPPTDVSLPTLPVDRAALNLRLPSFDLLGIAAPHPDRIPLRSTHSFSSLGAGPLSKPEDPLHALSPPIGRPYQRAGVERPPFASPQAARTQVEHLTPPTEPGTFSWGSFVNVRTAGLGSPPSSDPGLSPNLNVTGSASSPATMVPTDNEVSAEVGIVPWVQKVKEIITIESGVQQIEFVKVLSHALPCPSLTGHIFGHLIAAIHDRTTSHTAWINVFHAVPGRFTLSDLPKSPPSTPGPAVGGDEYFTSKVFDSAVAIPDYQLDSKLLPPTPRPVVPPRSINVSVVERFIPPTNTNEFAEMFQLNGRSLLYDRLSELSENGILLFVYPTKAGGQIFMQEYLGPILDPLLRTITVVNDLSSDLGKNLGQMCAVNYLDEYVSLHAQVKRFCERLNRSGSSPQGSVDGTAGYELTYASKEELKLERSVWANDWWIKQEKPRVREVVTRYFRQAKKLPVDSELTAPNLIQEVLDGVANRVCEGSGPQRGVEVGVFVIRKSA
ncbi:hypothetical protein BDV95DRAFT_489804 [Massariosphaeria phaeospora]|uniref:Uncharacterized protein n=1 Tax=Massariosphaeria phaeospora TaxID=100035 RepID=A0A7C8ICR8_9PLEO|nr:hypothetical protein BDV95DRAFT_489804 [Massariosphaeria phaeospora]